jgi:membrane fusion protein, copper/silver efflux system
MKMLRYALLVAAVFVAGLSVGARHGGRAAITPPASTQPSVLYYVDPMNPAHTSSEPGLAPCGMKLEPVYAVEAGQPLFDGPAPEKRVGTLNVSPARQQLIGIQLAEVKRTLPRQTLRLPGKVAVDETRVYRINAAVDGRITKAMPYAPGSLVKKLTPLAAYYSPDFLRAGQALLFALKATDRISSMHPSAPPQANAPSPVSDFSPLAGNYTNQLSGLNYDGQLAQFEITVKQNRDALKNFGMGELQLEELVRSRAVLEDIDIAAPVDGFILTRNISQGQSIEKGAELFRIADLSRVWVVADVFENDAEYLTPGLTVRVSLTHQGKPMTATISQVPPQFDPVSRSLKVRLELDNLDLALKPDMFVDVELPVELPPTILIPAEAVLDSGLRQTVYVHQNHDCFEPRVVTTGRHMGDQVQVLQGLEPGEQIVLSGNFLLDSESKMKQAAASLRRAPTRDPVCGMEVDGISAAAASRSSVYQGRTYHFCHPECRRRFEENPAAVLGRSSHLGSALVSASAVPGQAQP